MTQFHTLVREATREARQLVGARLDTYDSRSDAYDSFLNYVVDFYNTRAAMVDWIGEVPPGQLDYIETYGTAAFADAFGPTFARTPLVGEGASGSADV